MIYLEEFSFPSFQFENDYLADAFDYYRNAFLGSYRTDYYMGMVYPFNVLGDADLVQLVFKPITIFYGSNGAGKSTAINVIAEKLGVTRTTPYNSSSWMNRYVDVCSCKLNPEWETRMNRITNVLTSDDVFNMMLDARKNDEMQQLKSQALRKEFFGIKYGKTPKRSINLETREGIEELRELNATKKKTTNRFLTDILGKINRGYSNGENGLMYLTEKLQEGGLYLLDEPENSLSAEYQANLAKLVRYSSERCNAQFIIATHSPFLLSIPHASIIDLDSSPAVHADWWQLDNMKLYYNLFKSFQTEFEQGE